MRLVISASFKAILINEGSASVDASPQDIDDKLNNFGQPIGRRSLKGKTDSGVALGMSEAQVRKILGAPHSAFHSTKFSARELVYRRVTPKGPDGTSGKYSNYYLFDKGRLFYIELAYDLIGGA